MAEILKFHIIPHYKNSTLLQTIASQSPPSIQTSYGENVTITYSGGNYTVNNVSILTVDLLADKNTAIHTIGSVLVPTGPPKNVTDTSYTNSTHSGAFPKVSLTFWSFVAVGITALVLY